MSFLHPGRTTSPVLLCWTRSTLALYLSWLQVCGTTVPSCLLLCLLALHLASSFFSPRSGLNSIIFALPLDDAALDRESKLAASETDMATPPLLESDVLEGSEGKDRAVRAVGGSEGKDGAVRAVGGE